MVLTQLNIITSSSEMPSWMTPQAKLITGRKQQQPQRYIEDTTS